MSPHRTRGYTVTGRAKRDYREDAAPMLLLAWLLGSAGVAALLDPMAASNTSVAQILPHGLSLFETLWQLSYLLAAVLMFYGALKPEPLVEVLGTWLAAWAMLVNVMSLIALRGLGGTGTSIPAFVAAIGVCVWRIRVLHRRANQVTPRDYERQLQGHDE